MHLRLLLLIVPLGLALAACVAAPDPEAPLPGRVYDVAAGRFIDEPTVVAALAEADFVLLGERHGHLEHHRLQARLVRALQARWAEPAPVAFEMMTTDQQLAIVEHLDGSPGDAAGLGPALGWAESGWPDWELYAPIAEAALEADAPIVAANLPRPRVNAVLEDGPGALPASFLARTGLGEPLPEPLAADLRASLARAHCRGSVGPAVERMFGVQRARDAQMAERLATLAGAGPGILIAGAGHVRKDRGVPWYLARLRPDARVASLAFVPADRSRAARDLPYDYAWFTEPGPERDPCAGSRVDAVAP